MSDYKLDINGAIELSDYSSIYDYMEIVNENDNLTINLRGEKEDFDILCSMLREKGFNIMKKEYVEGNSHYILAIKRDKDYSNTMI